MLFNRNIIYCFLFLATLSLTACSHDSDEQLLMAAVDGLVTAVENRERREVRQYLARDFLAQRTRGWADVERIMLIYFRQNQNISIFRQDEQILINNGRGEVSMTVLITGANGLIPERGGHYQLEMLWHKTDGDWLLSRVNWERLINPTSRS